MTRFEFICSLFAPLFAGFRWLLPSSPIISVLCKTSPVGLSKKFEIEQWHSVVIRFRAEIAGYSDALSAVIRRGKILPDPQPGFRTDHISISYNNLTMSIVIRDLAIEYPKPNEG